MTLQHLLSCAGDAWGRWSVWPSQTKSQYSESRGCGSPTFPRDWHPISVSRNYTIQKLYKLPNNHWNIKLANVSQWMTYLANHTVHDSTSHPLWQIVNCTLTKLVCVLLWSSPPISKIKETWQLISSYHIKLAHHVQITTHLAHA